MWVPGLVSPAWFGRHKQYVHAALRLLLWSLPLTNTDCGVQKALRADARPGAGGALRDFWRVLIGTRILSVALTCLAMPASLALSLALQAHAAYMAASNVTICSSQLLAHPLSAARLRSLNEWLEGWFVLGRPGGGMGGGGVGGLRRAARTPGTPHSCPAMARGRLGALRLRA
jgi:hypothetical protein